VPQISLPCLAGCSAAATIILLGLLNYWIFIFRHWSRLQKTPQSKLDWMLHTLRRDNEEHRKSRPVIRKVLSAAMASGTSVGEEVPLTRGTPDQNDRKSIGSTVSNTFSSMRTSELEHGDDGLETPTLGTSFSGRSPPTATWFPQRYDRASLHAHSESWGMGGPNRDYNPVQQQSPHMHKGECRDASCRYYLRILGEGDRCERDNEPDYLLVTACKTLLSSSPARHVPALGCSQSYSCVFDRV